MNRVSGIALMLLLSSCASKEVLLKSNKIEPFPMMSSQHSKVENSPQIKVTSMMDLRTDKTNVGMARTGFFHIQTPVHTDIPVSEFVKTRIEANLSIRGFDVKETAKYEFQGRIRKLSVSEANTWTSEFAKCHLEMDFELFDSKSKKPHYRGKLYSEAFGSNSSLDATDSLGPALETCISMAIYRFISDEHVAKLLGLKLN